MEKGRMHVFWCAHFPRPGLGDTDAGALFRRRKVRRGETEAVKMFREPLAPGATGSQSRGHLGDCADRTRASANLARGMERLSACVPLVEGCLPASS